MNAANSLTLDFNSFVTTGNPNFANIVFTFLNSSNTVVFDSGISALRRHDQRDHSGSTLTAGQSYTFDLLFSEQVFGINDTAAFGTTQFYDTHTDGSFVTAGARLFPSLRPGR